MEDAVDVIRHNDKRIERQVRITCRQLLPCFYKYVTECRPIEKWLALPGTDGHEISAWLAVVVPFQTKRTAVQFFSINTHHLPRSPPIPSLFSHPLLPIRTFVP